MIKRDERKLPWEPLQREDFWTASYSWAPCRLLPSKDAVKQAGTLQPSRFAFKSCSSDSWFVTLNKFLQLSSLDCLQPLRSFSKIMPTSTEPSPWQLRNPGVILTLLLSFRGVQSPFICHGHCLTQLFTFHLFSLIFFASKFLPSSILCSRLFKSWRFWITGFLITGALLLWELITPNLEMESKIARWWLEQLCTPNCPVSWQLSNGRKAAHSSSGIDGGLSSFICFSLQHYILTSIFEEKFYLQYNQPIDSVTLGIN